MSLVKVVNEGVKDEVDNAVNDCLNDNVTNGPETAGSEWRESTGVSIMTMPSSAARPAFEKIPGIC